MKNRIAKFNRLLKKYDITILVFALSFIICFLLFLSFYPGIIPYDGAFQWRQVQSGMINNQHPFFSTFFLYLLSKIHNTTTIAFLFQIAVFSLLWSYFCYSINPNKKEKILLIVLTIFICIIPIYSLYSFTLWKDILYSYYLILIGIVLFKNAEHIGDKYYVSSAIGLLLALVFSYRLNGMIVVFLLICLFLLFMIKKRFVFFSKKNTFVIIAIFLVLIFAISVPKGIFIEKYNANNKSEDNSSYSFIISYSLWMMGAHIQDNNIRDENSLKLLDSIIPINKWKEIYNPYLINSTNENVDKNTVIQNQSEIIDIFLNATVRNPGTVIKHYIKSNSMLINPLTINNTYVYVFSFEDWTPGNYNFGKLNSKMPYLEQLYIKVINKTFEKPMIYFYCPATIFYLSILMAFFLKKKYGKRIYLLIIPMIFNTISLLPINLAQDLRYVYVNYLTFMIMLSISIVNYMQLLTKKNNLYAKKVFISSYNLDYGGIEKSLLNIVNVLCNYGYDVTLLLEKKEGIYVNSINKRVKIIEYKSSDCKVIIVRKVFNFINRIRFIIKYKNKFGVSICYATYSLPASFTALRASKKRIYYVHSNYVKSFNNKSKIIKGFFAKRNIDKFNKIVFVSNESKDDLINYYPMLKKRCVTINNIIDINELSNVNSFKFSRKTILYVGRVDNDVKRVDMIVELAHKCQKADYKINFAIVGDGKDLKYCKNLAVKYKLKNIKFLGATNCPYKYIKGSSALILVSRYEGFPVVFNEAIFYNKPILSTISVSDEQLKVSNGFGIVCSVDRLYDNISNILLYKPKKVDFSAINQKRIQKTIELIDELLNKDKGDSYEEEK